MPWMFTTAVSSTSYLFGIFGFLWTLPIAIFQIFVSKILSKEIALFTFILGTSLLVGDLHYFYELSRRCNIPGLLLTDIPEEKISKPISDPNDSQKQYYDNKERLRCTNTKSAMLLPTLVELSLDRINLVIRLSLLCITILSTSYIAFKFKIRNGYSFTSAFTQNSIIYILFAYGLISCLLVFTTIF